MLTQNVPGWEASFARAMFPLIRRGMAKAMNISPEGAQRSLGQLRELMERYGARLADGRRYLCGDTLTAADLTFAALASPVIFPSGTPRSRCRTSRPCRRHCGEEVQRQRQSPLVSLCCGSTPRSALKRSAQRKTRLGARPHWGKLKPDERRRQPTVADDANHHHRDTAHLSHSVDERPVDRPD